MAITIKEVAADCGLSWTTVSRVLNNREGHFSEKTRTRVLDAAQRLGYSQNTSARALRGLSTGKIGVIIDAPRDTGLSTSRLRQIDDRAREEGYRLVIGLNQGSSEREDEYLRMFQSDAVDGLIVDPTDEGDVSIYRRLLAQNLPLVTHGLELSVSTPHVSIDRELGGYLMAKHLVQRRWLRPMLAISSITSAGAKLDGLRRGYAESGLDLDRRPRMIGDAMGEAEGPAFGAAAVRAFLEKGLKFDAVVTVSDSVAMGAMQALMDAGLRVGQDVAVVGYSDEHFAAYLPVPLTTVHMPRERLGDAIFGLLLKQMKGGGLSAVAGDDGTYEQVVLKPELVVRESG